MVTVNQLHTCVLGRKRSKRSKRKEESCPHQENKTFPEISNRYLPMCCWSKLYMASYKGGWECPFFSGILCFHKYYWNIWCGKWTLDRTSTVCCDLGGKGSHYCLESTVRGNTWLYRPIPVQKTIHQWLSNPRASHPQKQSSLAH